MEKLWDRIFGLDYKRSIWVEESELGKKKALYHNNKRYFVKIPPQINKKITLRLRRLGKTRGGKTGNLLLHVWLNKGQDVRKSLWISESSARNGLNRKLFLDGKTITMVIPPNSYNGLTIRLSGLGKESSFDRNAPPISTKRKGNLLVKLFVYPDIVTPYYKSFETLTTDNMVLEGWVYRKIDEVVSKIGKNSFPINPIQAHVIADLYNDFGWRSIFKNFVTHLKLEQLDIGVRKSNTIVNPGLCETTVISQSNTIATCKYAITINEQFINNPFSVAAILAHELCHVIYSEKIDKTPKSRGTVIRSEKATLEMERTVDLLVFMYRIGEFQLRVARDRRLTLGYFNQEIFERIQVIVSRRLDMLFRS